MEEILQKIVDNRIKKIKEKGFTFGREIPAAREVPLINPDFTNGLVITEIKRGSPSEGRMNEISDPVKLASEYVKGGAGIISILTEEDFFFGSIDDLMKVKRAFPGTPVLRKDFLIYEEEMEISYRMGADLVLLIASVLLENRNLRKLKSMKERAESFGLTALIEVHSLEELKLVLKLKPKLIGINSRDLGSFKINRAYPVALKNLIDDKINVVYESGIRNYTDAFFAGSSGFKGILVGTSIVKSGDYVNKIAGIKNGFASGLKNQTGFYLKLFKKIYLDRKLAVKICGITNYEDAKLAVDRGAGIIGFILAKSPRQISLENAKEISRKIGGRVLKVAVVVDEYADEAAEAVCQGYFDAVQFHGDFDNDKCMSYNTNWYRAVRVASKEDFDAKYNCPIILYDAFSKEAYGGTGKGIDEELLEYAKGKGIDLCLAGGINADNVEDIVEKYSPLMIDVCSGLESGPGKKNRKNLIKFFKKIKHRI